MSRVYRSRQEYMEKLKDVMEVREDFKDLKYCRTAEGEEYLMLSNIIGQVYFFNITGYTEAKIFHTMAVLECGNEPSNFVKERSKLLELGRAFNK
jgi:hypothetical protein